MQEIPFTSGAEQDAMGWWRKVTRFRAGTRKWIKRKYRHRVRQWEKRAIMQELRDETPLEK